MSLGSIFNTARSAITTYQAAIQVTSNNLANASTKGYSRQRAVISATTPLHLAFGSIGTGVEMTGIVRSRDMLLDVQFRREQGFSGEFGLREQLLGQVESALSEPTDAGLSSAMDRFFTAYSDLANDPTSSSVRAALRESARELAGRFNRMDNEIRRVARGLSGDVQSVLAQVNDVTSQIADLNRQITVSEADGSQAPSLRDARDRLVDELSQHVQVQVVERPGGAIGVFAGGIPVVDGTVARALESRTVAGVVQVGLVGSPTALSTVGGELGARLDVMNTDIPATLARLDSLAANFVGRVNQVHQTGTNPLGQTAIDFFDPASTTAATMALSSDLLASSDAIAAGAGDALGAYQSGANVVALAMSALRIEQNAGLGVTFGAFHTQTVAEVGLAVSSARDNAVAHGALKSRADTHRQSVSGVLTDEEVISLIEFQQAYTAATRLVTVADEMTQSILQMVS